MTISLILYDRSIDVRKVKDILSQAGYYKRLRSTSKAYVKKKEFERWLDKKPLEVVAKVISRLAVLSGTKVYLFWNLAS